MRRGPNEAGYKAGAIIYRTKIDVSALGADPTHNSASWENIGSFGTTLAIDYTPPVDAIAWVNLQADCRNDTAGQRFAIASYDVNTAVYISRMDAHAPAANYRIPMNALGYLDLTADVELQLRGRIYVYGGIVTVDKTATMTHLDLLVFKQP